MFITFVTWRYTLLYASTKSEHRKTSRSKVVTDFLSQHSIFDLLTSKLVCKLHLSRVPFVSF